MSTLLTLGHSLRVGLSIIISVLMWIQTFKVDLVKDDGYKGVTTRVIETGLHILLLVVSNFYVHVTQSMSVDKLKRPRTVVVVVSWDG